MTQKFIHGTSYENAMKIIENQKFNNNVPTVWTCSNSNLLYLRRADTEDSELLTIEAGQLAAAYFGSQSTQIAVIELTMSNETAEELIEDDDSITDPEDTYQIDKEYLDEYIQSGLITCQIKFYEKAYIPYLRPFYLSFAPKTYMNIKDSTLKDAVNLLCNNGIFLDDLLYYEDIDHIIDLKPELRKVV